MSYMHSKDNIVTIEKLDHQGRGITHINGKIAFVENALEGEKVLIEITKETTCAPNRSKNLQIKLPNILFLSMLFASYYDIFIGEKIVLRIKQFVVSLFII